MKNKTIKNLNFFEQRIYSQNGEDGLLKIIFYKIGATDKFCVEFGVEDGRECNTRYLIEKKGWRYLHMDGSNDTQASTKKEVITAENINALFLKYHVPEEFDLLSIDIDYNTYWVWKALDHYRPRVVVIEYNASIPPSESKAAVYDPNGVWDGTDYYGASLLAFVNLGESKGYTCIGCESKGVNAFFIRNDLINDHFMIKEINALYRPPQYGNRVNEKFIGHPPSHKVFVSV